MGRLSNGILSILGLNMINLVHHKGVAILMLCFTVNSTTRKTE